MRKFDIKELHDKEMEILLEVDRICKKYNINYYLTWGSALGAIRHKGFIPWDDDIDISMFWDDYVKFEEICKVELGDKFFLQNIDTDKENWVAWNRIRMNDTTSMYPELKHMNCHFGICMDIFPIISIPESSYKRKIQDILSKAYRFICFKPLVVKTPYKYSRVKYTIYKLLPDKILNSLRKVILKQITKYKKTETRFCGELLDVSYNKAITPTDIYGTPAMVDFEGHKFPVPQKYHEYLTQCYGAYMVLPDENERVGHGNIIVDTCNSYKKYQ